MPPPGDLPNLGFEPRSLSLMSPELAGRFFTTSASWEAPIVVQLLNVLKSWYSSYGTVDKNPSASAGDIGLILGLGGFHMMRSNEAHGPQLLKPLCPRARAPQQEKPLQ